MLDASFSFKGKNSKTNFGIYLQDWITVTPAIPKKTKISVPGRSGDLHYYEDAFENRTITARCFILSSTLSSGFRSINEWLLGEPGYFKFQDEDTARFYLASVSGGVQWMPKMGKINPFTLTFDAKPQHFLETGENAVSATISSGSGSATIQNPTAYKAFPVFELTTSGHCDAVSVAVSVGGANRYTVTFSDFDAGTVIYDSELQMVTNRSDVSVNVTGDADGLYIPGNPTGQTAQSTVVTFTDSTETPVLTTAKVKPRWWDI